MIESLYLDRLIERNSQSIVSDMDGEKVMLNIANGKYYNLGHVGGRIWELLEVPITTKQLVSQLMDEYEVEKDQCEEHVASFIQLLSAEGLVVISEGEDEG